ncbi:hypothetical protein K435DRAFT_881568 [Dendrothele bispora CBS 962.96]|uniref:Uncharacterized protein n=1 Tax=Dendrothele bispora (strain CBS 962.96) TaxID=1314807 RepID=A0A4S8KI72_DENBC|nr:hypothetical protein K435DRAFT_881568 [Dendrothele bispora CBS 962.96]
MSRSSYVNPFAMLNSRKDLRAQANLGVITDSGMGLQSEQRNAGTASYEQAEILSTQTKSRPIILAPLRRVCTTEADVIDIGNKLSDI